VTLDPFAFTPNEFGHRCLVTWISTTDHPLPNPPPRIVTGEALAAFLIAHPNYAHHNIDIVQDTTGVHTETKPFTSGEEGGPWVFGIQTINCNGFVVGFSCAKPLRDGRYIQMADTTVTTNDKITYTIDRDVEAGFQANVSFTYDQRNITPPSFSVSFIAYYDVAPDHWLYPFAKPYEHFGVAPQCLRNNGHRGIEVGAIGVMKGTVRS
jgi:hypothetical protein